MSNTSLSTPWDENERHFIIQIKKELSLNTRDAVRLIQSVLHAVRQTLSLKSASVLLNQLPDFLKLAFVTNWKENEKRIFIKHLDEFVSLIMEKEENKNKSYFKNEVLVLSVVVLTLKKLFKIVDLEQIEDFSPALLQELKEIPAEAA